MSTTSAEPVVSETSEPTASGPVPPVDASAKAPSRGRGPVARALHDQRRPGVFHAVADGIELGEVFEKMLVQHVRANGHRALVIDLPTKPAQVLHR